MRGLLLLLVWLRFTIPATEPAPGLECREGGTIPETGLSWLEVHGSPQWLGYETSPRAWPGLRDSLIARMDLRGKAGGRADSLALSLAGTWSVWGVTVDAAGNRSCETPFLIANPELASPMPQAWPFRVPRAVAR